MRALGHHSSKRRLQQGVRSFASPCSSRPASLNTKPNIIGISKDDLTKQFEEAGLENFRVNQVWPWLYKKGVTSFQAMKNVGSKCKEELEQKYDLNHGIVAKDTLSDDGTRKLLMQFDQDQVETVFIPEPLRGTVCVSSQVGCTYSCTFCYTGTQKIRRNLKGGEIVSQVLAVKDLLYDYSDKERVVTNVVFMGQGEPFFNYQAVSEALELLLDPSGLGFSKRRITVSTSGVVPKIRQLGKDFPGVGLAISLHATTNELRSEIVTANRDWSLEELLDACREHPQLSPHNRITFEYVMLKGVNDSLEEAKRLAGLLKDIPSLVNIIPFNPWPGTVYESSSNNQIHLFAQTVEENGVPTTVRWPRGRDILAACGQLVSDGRTIEGTKG